MTRFLYTLAAGLVLAACGDGSGNAPDDTDTTGATDVTSADDPFTGDDAVEVRFDVQFGDVVEPCLVTLACEGKTVTQSSSNPFTVDADAECIVTIGDNEMTTKDGRPTHQSADGLMWTYTEETDGFAAGTVTLVADWYFEAPELRCTFWDREVTATDVFVDEANTFEIPDIASDGSWFQVLEDSFNYGGRALERGWSVNNLIIEPNSASFTVDKVSSTFDVACSW